MVTILTGLWTPSTGMDTVLLPWPFLLWSNEWSSVCVHWGSPAEFSLSVNSEGSLTQKSDNPLIFRKSAVSSRDCSWL